MAHRIRRRNERSLGWIKAGFIALATFAALGGTAFKPGWGSVVLSLLAGALTLAAVDLGVLVSILAVSLPVTAADPVVGIIFVILGIVGMRYLGSDGGRVFVIVASAVAGMFAGPAWAAAAIAGYMLGASEGALAAGIACGTAELVGLLMGRISIGGVVTGGGPATGLLAFGVQGSPNDFFSMQWLQETFSGFGNDSVQRVVDAFAGLGEPVALIAQPLVWALGAVITASFVKRGRTAGRPVISLVGAALGTLVPAAAAFVFREGAAFGPTTIATTALSSAALAVGFVWVAEKYFALEFIKVNAPSRPSTMATEDADVDELLRLISSAEEKLATQHTTKKVVMITDMKSFSRMTEEDGSVLTAKAIQRHRDLLLPLIEKHDGHGKSTGGDGLVAAFETAAGALSAAAEMQRALDAHNASHPDEREMTVRIGVADGEVVLDKGGRPFIGAALNLAARVMNLADGGQAFSTRAVADKAGGVVSTAPLGDFELKNIAEPVPVVEILWAPGQKAVDPRTRES